MIVSFSDKHTRDIWNGVRSKAFPSEIQEIARRKLRLLNSSNTIIDLLIPPSNNLEKLRGTLKDYYSIRINKRWRIIFIWTEGHAHNVRIIDYH